MKRVRITQLDGTLPNLALMKLSAFHKSLGDDVVFSKSIYPELGESAYDIVYASAIFSRSANAIASMRSTWPNALIGGTGTQHPEILTENICGDFYGIDYSMYPAFRPSIGFTQRGCRLKCSFCVVPTKEGKVRGERTVSDIWRGGDHPKEIHLLDNDFFGQPQWRERCQEIIDGRFKVCLNQGINVRLIHKDGAEMLARMDYRDDQFKVKRIYTAWDNRKDEAIFFKGVGILVDAGIKPSHIMAYMLCGYWPGETLEDVMFRFQKMKDMGIKPYPMVFDDKNKQMKRFQRWVIRRYHEFVPFEDYLKEPEPEGQLLLH